MASLMANSSRMPAEREREGEEGVRERIGEKKETFFFL